MNVLDSCSIFFSEFVNYSNATNTVITPTLFATTSSVQDRDYDAKVLEGSATEILIYSLAPGGERLAIQGRNLGSAFDTSDVIPLGIRCKKDSQASNTIQIGLVQFDGLFTTTQTVYLRELLMGGGYAYYDIKTTPHQFTITADIATDETRFALVFENPTTKTIAAQQAFTARLSPNPYTDGFKITVADSLQGSIKVQVFDLLGKLMEEGNYSNQELHNHSFGKGLSAGVYQAVITQEGYRQTIKAIKN